MALTTDSNMLALACCGSSVVYRFENGSVSCLRETNPQQNSSEISVSVCSDVSSSGRYYAFCHGKSLLLVDTGDWRVSNRWSLNKSASRVRFLPETDRFVVADKSGDVYVYSCSEPDKPGQLLLGHLSLLLDVLVSPDHKYIITSDRDEKIRVSLYPNSYNIHGYCLGHKEFVSSIGFLPHDGTVLVSCSGDSTIRFWNYVECIELLQLSTSPDIKEILKSENHPAPAVTDCCLLKLGTNASQIVVLFSNIPGVAIYLVNSLDSAIKCSCQQIIKTPVVPWHLAGFNDQFWLLLKDEHKYLASYARCDEGTFKETSSAERVISEWAPHKIHKDLQDVFNYEQVNILYKRKFDNLQEYFDKKKARLEAKAEEPQEK